MSDPHQKVPGSGAEMPADLGAHWLEQPATVKKLIWLLIVVCALLALSDFVYEKHPHFKMEYLPAFYGICGFIVCCGVAYGGKLLRRMLRRDEDYYER